MYVRIFNAISSISKLNIIYEDSDETYKAELLGNGSWWNLLKDLEAGKYDVAIGRLFMNTSSDAPADFGPLYYCDKILFMYPKEELIFIIQTHNFSF